MTFITLFFITFAVIVILNTPIYSKFFQILEVITGLNLEKPFNCPLCMTWWTTLTYVLIFEPTLPLILSTFMFAFLADQLDKLHNTY